MKNKKHYEKLEDFTQSVVDIAERMLPDFNWANSFCQHENCASCLAATAYGEADKKLPANNDFYREELDVCMFRARDYLAKKHNLIVY